MHFERGPAGVLNNLLGARKYEENVLARIAAQAVESKKMTSNEVKNKDGLWSVKVLRLALESDSVLLLEPDKGERAKRDVHSS